MRAGTLRNIVTVQAPGGARDAVGDVVTSWTDVANVPASIEPLTGREAMIAAQKQSSTTHRITIRYSSDVAALAASWRILWGARAFDITERRNLDERNRTLELICTEGLIAA